MRFLAHAVAFVLMVPIVASSYQAASVSASSLLQRSSATERALDVDESAATEELHEKTSRDDAADLAPEGSAPKADAKAANGTNETSAQTDAKDDKRKPKTDAPQEEAKKKDPTAINGTNATLATNTTQANDKASETGAAEDSGLGACVTKQDPRARAWWATTAKPGTPCVFGVDSRDEGRHCIPEMEFGSMGWCFTKKDKSEWGSCSDSCPLYGHHKTLGTSIDGLAERVDAIIGNLSEAAGPAGMAKAASEEPAEESSVTANATSDTTAGAANATNTTSAKPKAEAPTDGEKKNADAKNGAKKEAAALVQTGAKTRKVTNAVHLEAALASTHKAERQAELWARIAERVLRGEGSMDEEDSLEVVDEALKKARAWQKIAEKRSATVTELMQTAESYALEDA